MNTAAIYVRVSTDAQADNDRVSLPDQIRRCLDRALADGYEVAKPHIFSDTVSGTKDETDRPGFGALMASARARSFERVYVLALDRLSRDLIVGVRTLEEFEKLGLGFVSLQEAGVENPLVRNLLLTLASEERKKIVARTMNGKRIKRARGQFVSGTVPYGYRRADGLTLEPCPEEAPVLRRIYEDMIAGGRTAFLSAPLSGLLEGGVPVLVEGQVAGAIGVSGVKSDQDAQVAKAGVAAVVGG